jgi:hypothetical protein
MVAKVADHMNSDLPEGVKLALTLVERWVLDMGQVEDAFFDRLTEHYSDKEIVELGIAIGYFDFSHRFNAVMGVTPVHPGSYDVATPAAPEHMRAHLAAMGLRPPADVAAK